MTQYTSYDQVGKKEDISDIISNISPTKTPFQSMIGSDKVKNTLFQWQEDSLRSVAENAQVEGFTAAATARTPTVMRSNYTQIMQDTFNVSGTADVVSTYGRAKESAYQASKAAAALKRDLEHALVGTAQTAVAGDSATARKMAGFQAQVDSSMFTYTGSTSTKPDEAALIAALQDCYNEGAEPSTVMVTPTNSIEVAAIAAATGRTRDIGNTKKVVNAVDLYVSPFGEQRIVLNRFLKDKDTLIFEPEQWQKATLRPWFRETLAKTGDNTTMMIVGEFSLKHKNQKASAVIREATAP